MRKSDQIFTPENLARWMKSHQAEFYDKDNMYIGY